ncbi:MAG: phage tail protein [Thermomicrobiales bacterium]
MGSPYIGEIRMFAGNFAPQGWAFCDGSVLPITGNETLFTLIGTTYGGDGVSTFALPDLRGRVPIHQGTDPFGNIYTIAQNGGVEQVALTTNQIPTHTHPFLASTNIANQSAVAGNVLAQPAAATIYYPAAGAVSLNANSIGTTGGSQPHDNHQPYLGINFIISLFGIYPSQN